MPKQPIESINRIRVLPGEKSNERIYAISKLICPRSFKGTYTGPAMSDDGIAKLDRKMKKADPASTEWPGQSSYEIQRSPCLVVNALLEIPSIVQVVIAPYRLEITIAAVFDWEEIEDEILSTIREVFFQGDAYKDVELQDLTKDAGVVAANSNKLGQPNR